MNASTFSHFLMTLVLFGSSACTNGGNGSPVPSSGGPPAINLPPSLTVFSNTSDPRIIEAGTSDGTQIQFFGRKDSAGVAQSVYAIAIAFQGATTQFDLDTDGLPAVIHASNGSKLFLEWDTVAKTAVLTAQTPGGQNQVSTLIDFNVPIPLMIDKAATNAKAKVQSTDAQNLAPRGGRPLTITMARPQESKTQPPLNSSVALLGTSGPEVFTTVTNCGQADDDLQVLTSVFDELSNDLIGTFPCFNIGSGVFQTSIPFGNLALANDDSNCASIALVLETVCSIETLFGATATTQLCLALTAAIDAVNIPAGEAALLNSACAAVTPLIQLYCATAGATPIPGAPSVLDVLCDADFVNTIAPDPFRVESCVVLMPANAEAQDTVFDANSTFPVANSIDLGLDPSIRSLTLVPNAPVAFQDYVATADIFCLPMDSLVTVSISGTDGYTDSVSFPIPVTQMQGFFMLNVPGGAQGVQDTVTTLLTLIDGTSLSKTAFLVFD